MPQLLKRPEAENDLEEIWWFIIVPKICELGKVANYAI